ncbi:MAG: alpha-(1-_3)-arabinofuranosyltransferase family protein [Nocardioides sp.]|uniref:alpha-(1->3)-arabinofuranosyltransferase domain-containing protein n=1 Tax=Nocardioides sp. TaxID=35761 RepID=UPI003F049180
MTPPATVRATAPLRMWGYLASLALLAFMQAPGRIVADTKIDLALSPWAFLGRATHLWDGLGAFGQLQNQAYGYLWPMGPFFGLGDLLGMPPWIVQRLWWTLLLGLAFFGVVRLAQAMGIGSGWAQVAAGYAFVLTPRVATLLGASSVELWPTALIPWVLLVLVRATHQGSVVRAGAVAALLVICAGGVNATAVSAVLPLGVIWILTRAPGPRRWRLLFWWGLFTVVGTLWWLVPLLLLGGYSAPFLDYIETAAVTTAPTDAMRTLLGVSNWVAYLDADTYTAGNRFLVTPYLMLNTALLVGLGLAGIAMRGSEHRRFLLYGLLAGMVLVGFGYTGDMSGWAAQDRQSLLDEALSPLRNSHKYDGVLRLVLVLGLARIMTEVPRRFAETVGQVAVVTARVIIVVVFLGLLTPWTNLLVATASVEEVPGYWEDVAVHLEENSTGGTSLLLPAASFGNYVWGSTRDDIMQPLARSPWAARNVIPLAEPGNVVLLDGVTSILESGVPSEDLAPLLRSAGVDQVVLRNDLDRFRLGAPDPVYVRSVLRNSPGIEFDEGFGPESGGSERRDGDDNRILVQGGPAATYDAVEVYRVADPMSRATLVPATGVATVLGSPNSVAGSADRVRMFPSDASEEEMRDVVLTDTLRRREEAFQAVRWNAAATVSSESEFHSTGPEAFHRIADDEEKWQTTEVWEGVASVSASSSQADVRSSPPLDRSSHPGAVLDGDPDTSWRTQRSVDADGSWWQVVMDSPTDVTDVRVTLAEDSLPVDEFQFSAGGESQTVDAPVPGESRTYSLDVDDVSSLRITARGVSVRLGGVLAVAEVEIEGVTPRRMLSVPQAPEGSQVRSVELRRDSGRASCVDLEGTLWCETGMRLNGEDGDAINRLVHLEAPLSLDAELWGSLRRSPRTVQALAESIGIRVDGPTFVQDVAQSPLVMFDGDPGTTWLGGAENAWFDLTLPEEQRIDTLEFELDPRAVAARPTKVRVRSGGESAIRTLDSSGQVSLPGWRTDQLRIEVLDTEPTAHETGGQFLYVGTGISEVTVNGQGFATEVDVPCGQGPTLEVGDRTVETRATSDVASLLRGLPVELEPCSVRPGDLSAGEVELKVGENRLVVDPTDLLRVDRMALTSQTLATENREQVTGLELRTEGVESPRATYIHDTGLSDRLLVLGQNFNRGWTASVDGQELEPTRVNGWQQAWRVPAGTTGEVSFTFEPAVTYRAGLAIGALGALLVLVVALVARRREAHEPDRFEPLVAAPVRRVDALVLLAGLGLVWGWVGFGVGVIAIVLLKRRPAVEVFGGVAAAMLLGALPQVVQEWRVHDWSQSAGQACALVAVALLVGTLVANGPALWPGRRPGAKR